MAAPSTQIRDVPAPQKRVPVPFPATGAAATDPLRPTDGELLASFASGNGDDAFAELVRRHHGMVLGVCRRVLGSPRDADDAAQATFLILARKARQLRRAPSIAGWLYGVARNVSLAARRSEARRRVREQAAADLGQVHGAETVGVAAPGPRDGLDPRLDDALARLPERYRDPIVLHYLEGMSQERAAASLGLKRGTFSARLTRGREMLRQRVRRLGLLLAAPALFVGLTARAAPAGSVAGATVETISHAAGLAAQQGLIASTGALTAKSVLLAKQGLHAMFVSKLQNLAIAAAVAFGVVLLPAVVLPGPSAQAAESKVKESGVVVGTVTAKPENGLRVREDNEQEPVAYVPIRVNGKFDEKVVKLVKEVRVGDKVKISWKLVEGRRRILAMDITKRGEGGGEEKKREEPKREEPKKEEKKKEEKAPDVKFGTVIGKVTAKRENGILVREDGEQEPVFYAPRWTGGMPKDGGGLDKAMVAKIKKVSVGDTVRVRWEWEERRRVIELDVYEKPRD